MSEGTALSPPTTFVRADVPLCKAPNPQLLPRHPKCSHDVLARSLPMDSMDGQNTKIISPPAGLIDMYNNKKHKGITTAAEIVKLNLYQHLKAAQHIILKPNPKCETTCLLYYISVLFAF